LKVLGITGGIAMGKSAVTNRLRSEGFEVIDTDELARQLVEPGQPALAEIRSAFGSDVLHADGTLRRDTLAKIVFAAPEARKTLESILHPRIRAIWQEAARQQRTATSPKKPQFFVTIPLLFETGCATEFDATICIACSAPTQMARLRARGWSANESAERIASQLPIEAKMKLATYVIWTEGPPEVTFLQLRRLLDVIRP
jgi:dephospho-CoA kinase